MDETRRCNRADPMLELEPLYPYSADWWPRCRRRGRWAEPGQASARPRLLVAPAAPRRRRVTVAA